MPTMNDDLFTAGYLTGTEHRMITAADTAAEGDWQPEDGYLRCPHQTGDSAHECDFTAGWAEAWT